MSERAERPAAERGPQPRPRPTRIDHLIGAVMFGAYLAVLLGTVDDLGLSRDESMYVQAADAYLGWYQRLMESPRNALKPAVIATHFRVNHEHPALVKTLFGFSHALDDALVLFPSPSTGYRVVGMLCGAALLWLIYIMGVHYGGRTVGAFAALAYALLPRPFYHAHLDCFDVPVTLAITATCFAYLRSLEARRSAIYCGLLFGAALATKHNSWVVPGILGIHHLCIWIFERRLADDKRRPVARPYWFVSMLLFGPLVLFVTWPWLWHHGWSRLAWYAGFHMRHAYYNMAYFGKNYFYPPFPISFPWVMTLFTLPVTTLTLALVGATRESIRLANAFRRRARYDDPTYSSLLFLGAALAPMIIIALPSTPIFGGTKHWMTAYPFLCLFAGLAFSQLVDQARAGRAARTTRSAMRALPLGLGSLMLMPGLVETIHSHPFALSHYGVAAGGVPGAADLGMNRQFWGFTTRSLTAFLNRHLPSGGTVYVCDTTFAAFTMLAKDGHLREDIRPTQDIARADYALVHHEHHFAEVDFQIWTSYGDVTPETVLLYDGVPIVSVYRNPSSRRAAAGR